MTVKLTVILSNDKELPIRDGIDKEILEQVAKKQYQEAFNSLVSPNEKVIIEKCELVSSGTEK